MSDRKRNLSGEAEYMTGGSSREEEKQKSAAKIKICGLRRKEDIEIVNRYQPDYVGFVFAKSKRQVDEETAADLKQYLHPQMKTVGVFVNETPERIVELCRKNIIDIIQLHGDEEEAFIQKLLSQTDKKIIKAVRVSCSEDILKAQQLSCHYLLLDTYTKDAYGGCGKEFDLSLVPHIEKPFFLAGGLTAENVSEKIERVYPFAVDISSGVEGADGWKSEEKIRKFISKVRLA